MNATIDVISDFDADHRHLEEHAVCIVNDAWGSYLPLYFIDCCDPVDWNIDPADADILLDGPDHAHYWDTWDYVLNYAYHVDKDGKTWRLYHDEDLFALPDMD